MAIYNKNGNGLTAAYDYSGASVLQAFDVNGSLVWMSGEIDYDNFETSILFNYPVSSMQGFAIYDGKIAQVREDSALHIIDIKTGTKLKEVTMDMGHGNSCQFSSVFYNPNDEFPLFYIRNTGVWVYRIQGTSSILIKKYSFSADIIGTYVAGFGIDDDNNIFYTASYTEGTYQTKTGLMRICSWDMTDETDNGDGTYSFALIDSNDFSWFDRFNAVQGCCFYNDYFFISCGLSQTAQYVVAVDPETLDIAHVITCPGTQETEGCAWLDHNTLIIGQKTATYTYKKLVFQQ